MGDEKTQEVSIVFTGEVLAKVKPQPYPPGFDSDAQERARREAKRIQGNLMASLIATAGALITTTGALVSATGGPAAIAIGMVSVGALAATAGAAVLLTAVFSGYGRQRRHSSAPAHLGN